MSDAEHEFSSLGFAKTFVVPGLLIFLVPVGSLLSISACPILEPVGRLADTAHLRRPADSR